MSTNSEIELERIENGKNSLIDSINNKGVSVPEGTPIDELSLYVDDIPTPTAAGDALGLVKSGGDVTIADGVITVNDDSHNHVIANVDGLQDSLKVKLSKTTYEESKELALGSNGKVCLGKFGAYDTNITIELNSTTHLTYHATIVIQSQNIVANGTGGSASCYVYDDADNHITPLISVFRPYGSASRQIEVYANLPGWSKNLVHVQGVAISDGGMTDVLTSVSAIPTTIDGKAKVTPVNVLTANFASKGDINNLNDEMDVVTDNFVDAFSRIADLEGTADSLHAVATSGSYNDLTDKPTIPTIPSNYVTTDTAQTISGKKTFTASDTIVSGCGFSNVNNLKDSAYAFMRANSSNPFFGLQVGGTPYYLQATSSGLSLGPTSSIATSWDSSGNVTMRGTNRPKWGSNELAIKSDIPTDYVTNTKLEEVLGSYVNDIDALLGG